MIDADGEQVGVLPIDEALKLSEAASLDLVEVMPNAEPPVCRVMDYGKFKFEQSKKAQVSRKKQVRVQVKEVKFRPGTEEADYQVKMRNLRRFIDHGDKVKVSLRFRGREMAHQDLGAKLLKRVEEDLVDEVVVEQRPLMEGRVMVMMLNGKKK